MRSIRVRRPLTPSNALDAIILAHPGIVYRSIVIVLSQGQHATLMYFEGAPEELATLERAYVEDRPANIRQIEVVERGTRSRVLYKVEDSSQGPYDIAGLVYEHFGPQCVARVRKSISGAQWDILTFEEDAVDGFLEALGGADTDVRSEAVSSWELSRYAVTGGITPAEDLTAQEERTLRAAIRLGYFEAPRRATVRDVAKALGLPRSTAHNYLQNASAKVIQRTMADW